MGVKSLQSFLKNNESYFSDKIVLRDCDLVLDANNVMCYIFSKIVLDKTSANFRNDVYGGDMVLYARTVRCLFENLLKCGIKPILVFDGSVIGKASMREFVLSKEKETYQRGLEKFKRAKTMKESSSDEEILMPKTLNTIFRNVATDMNIPQVQTIYEADSHIARIANERDCPVLTNDSDFIIYILKRGFVLLDWFEHQNLADDRPGRPGIRCSLFSQRKLSKSLPGLQPECLPLMSVILGNDYVEPGTFDRVVESICNRHYEGFLEARSFNHRRIANLLTWLRQRSLNEAIDYILHLVHHTHQEKLKKILEMFMRNYNIEEVDDFDTEMDAVFSRERRLTEKDELQPREFLKRLMENEGLGSLCLDMIFHNTHYCYSIVDDFRLPSSGYVEFRPLSLALVLLRPQSYTGLTTYRRKIKLEEDSFSICDRLKDEYTKMTLRPMENLENFGPLDHLDCHSMIVMEPALKKNMLMACFHFNAGEFDLIRDTVGTVFDGDYANQAVLCMILVKYIGIETKIKPEPEFVDALLATLFFYAACAGGLNRRTLPCADNYGKLALELRTHSIMINNRTYLPLDEGLFRRIMHFISQLQTAFRGFVMINTLLSNPIHPAAQGLFMNCVLIYRLTKLFRLRQEKLEGLFKGVVPFLDMCDTVRLLVRT